MASKYRVILLGKTRSGISSSGNTIITEKTFISKKIFKSVTREVQMKTVDYNDVTLDVYDTPGLFNTEITNDRVLDQWKSLLQQDESICTVVLLVIKIDIFTQEDKEAVDLIEDFIPERLVQNTWILFTRGDELEREDLTIEQFIEDTEEVKNLVERFQNRYHVFNNISSNPNQVRTLINKIKAAARNIYSEIKLPDPEDPHHRRIVLLGKTGVGKSTTGNTILGKKRFTSKFGSMFVTSDCKMEWHEVLGRTVSVIDTPGLFNTKLSKEEIGRSIYLSSPGPHAFLCIQPVNIRFTEKVGNVIKKLEKMFGSDMKKYTIVLFTYGDQLKGRSVDEVIKENSYLSSLVQQCGGGYHVFNNENKNKNQVRELLQKIDSVVEKNGGTCYSNKMHEEAARIRRDNEKEDTKGFNEFYKKYKKILFIGALVSVGARILFGSLIGAAVGAATGCCVCTGAVIGAAIGSGCGAVVGAALSNPAIDAVISSGWGAVVGDALSGPVIGAAVGFGCGAVAGATLSVPVIGAAIGSGCGAAVGIALSVPVIDATIDLVAGAVRDYSTGKTAEKNILKPTSFEQDSSESSPLIHNSNIRQRLKGDKSQHQE